MVPTDPGKPKATFRPMTADEQALARAMRRGAFIAGKVDHFDRQFAQDIHRRADQKEPQISEKQAVMLRKLITKYRDKVRAADIPAAEKHLLEEPKKRGSVRQLRAREDVSVRIEIEAANKERDAAIEQREDAMRELGQVRAENLELRQKLKQTQDADAAERAETLQYINAAKAALGERQVSGEPLAEAITRLCRLLEAEGL